MHNPEPHAAGSRSESEAQGRGEGQEWCAHSKGVSRSLERKKNFHDTGPRLACLSFSHPSFGVPVLFIYLLLASQNGDVQGAALGSDGEFALR